MSQSRIRWIIIFAVLTQAGLISLQVYWLRRQYTDQKQAFEERLSKACDGLFRLIDPGDPLHNAILEWKSNSDTLAPKQDIHISQLLNKLNSELDLQGIDTQYTLQVLITSEAKSIFQTSRVSKDLPTTVTNSRNIFYSSNPPPEQVDYWIGPVCFSCKTYIGLNFKRIKPSFFLSKIMGWVVSSIVLTFIQIAIFIYILYSVGRQKRLSRLKDAFINHMTHELNTPVFSISLALKHLSKLDFNKQEKEAREYLQIIGEEKERLQSNVQRALDITRLESEVFILGKTVFDLKKMLRQLQQLFRKTKQIDIELLLPEKEDDLKVQADRYLLFNTLYNLLDNAVKYADKTPVKIQLGATKEANDHLLIMVRDNGPGIPVAEQQRVFEKFYRSSLYQDKVKGSGLGLSYAYLVVKAHQGRIEVESKKGEGSTFKVWLAREGRRTRGEGRRAKDEGRRTKNKN